MNKFELIQVRENYYISLEVHFDNVPSIISSLSYIVKSSNSVSSAISYVDASQIIYNENA